MTEDKFTLGYWVGLGGGLLLAFIIISVLNSFLGKELHWSINTILLLATIIYMIFWYKLINYSK